MEQVMEPTFCSSSYPAQSASNKRQATAQFLDLGHEHKKQCLHLDGDQSQDVDLPTHANAQPIWNTQTDEMLPLSDDRLHNGFGPSLTANFGPENLSWDAPEVAVADDHGHDCSITPDSQLKIDFDWKAITDRSIPEPVLENNCVQDISGENGEAVSMIELQNVSGSDRNGDHKEVEPYKDSFSACFGVIVADITSSTASNQGPAPVTVKLGRDLNRLYFQESGKYAGLLILPGLYKLDHEFKVRMEATLIISRDTEKVAGTGLKTNARVKVDKMILEGQTSSIRIVIYGFEIDTLKIGELLSNESIYLQHPSGSECEAGVEYRNPHYLVRPDGHLPALEALSITENSDSSIKPKILSMSDKSRILELFSSSNSFGDISDIQISSRIKSTLKDHQREVLKAMIEREHGVIGDTIIPSIWEVSSQDESRGNKYRHKITGEPHNCPKVSTGGVLADEMGLGKTLSLLALICSSLDAKGLDILPNGDGRRLPTLVIAPKSSMVSWTTEIEKHIHPDRLSYALYYGSDRLDLQSSFMDYDLILTTYETLLSDRHDGRAIYSIEWHRIILDEAHHIRNRNTKIFKAVCAVRSQHHWCLTGTPIHNSLDDYGALISFLNVHPFQEKPKFDYWIARPFRDGKEHNLKSLQNLIEATCIRRTKATVEKHCKMPDRTERIEWVKLNDKDQALYDFFKDECSKLAQDLAMKNQDFFEKGENKSSRILSLINVLRLICDHGEQLLPQSALDAWKSRDEESLGLAVVQGDVKQCYRCQSDIEEPHQIEFGHRTLQSQHLLCFTCLPNNESRSEINFCPISATRQRFLEDGTFVNRDLGPFSPTAKVEALLRNLCEEQMVVENKDAIKGTKSVVFSYWTRMLDLIQQALRDRGFGFQRIDGQTSLENRRKAIERFNNDDECTVMLASIGSAGEGIDLTIANCVHLVEPHWNPMIESQAVDRIHRIGQQRAVNVTRYITVDSIETYVQKVQADKLRLINQSIGATIISEDDFDIARSEMLKIALATSDDSIKL